MIDIKLLRDSPDVVRANMKKKGRDTKVIDLILKKDEQWRKLKGEADTLRAERNEISKKINLLKKSGKDAKKELKEAKEIPERIEQTEKKSEALRLEIDDLLKKVPNIMHSSVPAGKDASQNVVEKIIGKPKKVEFEIKNHAELAEKLGLADFESSAKTSGTGFYYLLGNLALLNQAMIRYAIDTMVKEGFTYVETPLMLSGDVIKNVTDLHDQQNQIYKIEGEDKYLIGTSEHALIGRYIDTILHEKNLPVKQTSYSMCFRKEIGSHGIDEKGIFRTHQFNKVEMIVICKPEESMSFFEKMKSITTTIFKELGIPIRILQICSGDLGDLKSTQVDIEAWSPRKKDYFEVASCSNLTDAQARRLKIRIDGKNGKYTPHTLNNTALATSRAMVAILENYQNKDGSVDIPKVLLPYMQGVKRLEPIK